MECFLCFLEAIIGRGRVELELELRSELDSEDGVVEEVYDEGEKGVDWRMRARREIGGSSLFCVGSGFGSVGGVFLEWILTIPDLCRMALGLHCGCGVNVD